MRSYTHSYTWLNSNCNCGQITYYISGQTSHGMVGLLACRCRTLTNATKGHRWRLDAQYRVGIISSRNTINCYRLWLNRPFHTWSMVGRGRGAVLNVHPINGNRWPPYIAQGAWHLTYVCWFIYNNKPQNEQLTCNYKIEIYDFWSGGKWLVWLIGNIGHGCAPLHIV